MIVSSDVRTTGRRRPKTSKQERVCPICSREFNKAEHLLRHYRSHTKERPFQCSVCGRVYTRQDTLLRHVRSSCHRKKAGEESILDGETTSGNGIRPRSNYTTPEELMNSSVTHENTINGGNHISVIGSSSPLPENRNSNLPEQLDIQSIQVSDVGLEAGWESWLLCDDFNLEAVNSSLLQATTGEASHSYHPETTQQMVIGSPQAVSQPMYEKPQSEGGPIRTKWHTHCESIPFEGVTLDPALESGRINECYREELAERLKPRVQTGILPSTTFIQLCLRAYFRHFQPIFPVMHEPTFYPCKRNAVLLLSICSIGSLFLGSPRATDHGISMFERLQKANVSSWEIHISSPPDLRIAALQSALIGQAFGFLLGRPKDLAGIDFFHGGIAAWARKGNIYRTEQSTCNPTDLSDDALEIAWKNWAAVETKKRIALAIAMQDAELSKLHHHESVLRHGCDRLPITSPDKLFAAPSATVWKRLILQENDRMTTLAQVSTDIPNCSGIDGIRKDVSSFGQCTTLESISVLACESHQPTAFRPNKIKECQELLMGWFKCYQSSNLRSSIWDSSLMMLWHSSFIMLYTNLDVLERACGRDGSEPGTEALSYAQQWAMSQEAKRCLLHALYIQKTFEAIPIGDPSPIHLPLCLYQCGTLWFCFGKFGPEVRFSAKDADQFPEFQLLRTGDNQTLNEGPGSSEREWYATDQVLICIDMLRRVPHWKLPSNLASTLLALIEEENGIF